MRGFWTPKRIAELMRLWDTHETQAAIGAALGCSRSWVSATAKRLGLRRKAHLHLTAEERQRRTAHLKAYRADYIEKLRLELEALNATPLPPLPAHLREALERRARRER